jgi:hypothetical protein
MKKPDPQPALALAFRAVSDERGTTLQLRAKSNLRINGAVPSDAARELFFGRARHLCATLGNIHPNLPKGTIHSSTLDGLESIIKILDLRETRNVPNLAVDTVEGSLAILGGPVANLHARLIMGCGGLSPLLGVELPVRFDINLQDTPQNRLETEPWRVVVGDRTSSSECLVITSLPTPSASDRVTIFSGLHGAGTRAVDLVLKNERLLERLRRETRGLAAWQSIIEVQSDDQELPISIGDHRSFEINLNQVSKGYDLRNRLFLSAADIHQLLGMSPPSGPINVSDPYATSMENVEWLDDHRLPKGEGRGKTIPGDRRLTRSDPPTPERRADLPVTFEPRFENEGLMNMAGPESTGRPRRRWGRPPMPDSSVKLSNRTSIMFSDHDLTMIEAIIDATGAASVSQVIRDALRRDFARLGENQRKSKSKAK